MAFSASDPKGTDILDNFANLGRRIFLSVVDSYENVDLNRGSFNDVGLPPEKWSSLKYGLWPEGGLRNAEEETQGGRDCRQASTG
jgi:hypothetical protein